MDCCQNCLMLLQPLLVQSAIEARLEDRRFVPAQLVCLRCQLCYGIVRSSMGAIPTNVEASQKRKAK